MKQLGDFPNYDSSTFMEVGPISIKGKKAPVTVDEKTGKNKITDAKVKEKITQFLMDRTVDLDDHAAKEWDAETKYKVSTILEILSGNEVNTTQKQASKSSSDNSISTNEADNEATFGETNDAEDFFDIDSDD